jgi:hypothetical protein
MTTTIAELTTQQQVRVAAAKDVLERLANRRAPLMAEQGTYTAVNSVTHKICKVCAVGALFLGSIECRLFTRIREGEVLKGEYEDALEYGLINDRLMQNVVEKVFDQKQLGLIEAAFETELRGVYGDQSINGEDASRIETYDREDLLEGDDLAFFHQLQDAVHWGKRFDDDDDRLEAIMKNIVANEGDFVIDQ